MSTSEEHRSSMQEAGRVDDKDNCPLSRKWAINFQMSLECVPYLLLVSKLFPMAGPPNNIPIRAKGYLESGLGLITTLTLTHTLTLTPTLSLTRNLILTRTLNRALTLTLTLTLTLAHTLRRTRTPPRTHTLSRTLTLTLSYP